MDTKLFSRRNVLAGGAVALAAPSLPLSTAFAQSDYPSSPIRAISMFPPGAGADGRIRYYSAKLAEKIGKTVVVENRAGAFGNIATETVARSKPDGYTIYICPSSSMLVANRYIFKNLTFDPLNDFEHITTLHEFAFSLIVRSDRFHSVPEITSYLKEKGDKASYGTIAAPGYVAGEVYKAKFNLATVEVKYKEPNSLINDILNGQIDYTFVDLNTVAGPVKDGKFKALCMTSAEALKNVPGVPGAREAGIPDLDLRNFWSVHVPAKTPKAICDKLELWFNEIAASPDVIKFNAATGADPLIGNSKMLRELLERETRNWAEYARIAKLVPI